jgi:lipid-A-disaccharide synthase
MQVLISAGEASGDMYGAQLIEALRRRGAELRSAGRTNASAPTQDFFGAGGERMLAAGCDIVVDAKDLAVVGITEILSHLPKILGLYRKLLRAADQKRPAIAVVIDSPAFNWRVARQMRRRGVPVVYYVCPQFWAWRQGRVKLLRKYVDKALVIFPFEEKFYRDRGVDATFVGHPLADLPLPAISRDAYAAEHGLDAAKQWVTLMPGSRRKEVRMNLPTMLEAAERLERLHESRKTSVPQGLKPAFLAGLNGTAEAVPYPNPACAGGEPGHPKADRSKPGHPKPAREEDRFGAGGYEFLLPVARTLDASFLRELIGAPHTETRKAASLQGNVHLVPDALPALYHSRAGIVASGTATVEAAIMGTPFVMVYRVSPLTYALGKPRVKVPYFAMVNLIAEEEVVPELVQNKFTAENIVAEMNKIMPDGPPRQRMIERLAAVKAKLKQGGNDAGHQHPSERAAEIILQMIA